MIELGQLLKERRVVLGMDLEDVERRTKIRKRYLEALEDGNWSVLPGEVYARGFVRSYAECVELDGLELLEKYIDQPHAEMMTTNPGKGAERPQQAPPRPVEEPHSTPRSTAPARDEHQDVKPRPPVKRPPSEDDGIPYVPASFRASNRPMKSQGRERRGTHAGSIVGQGLAVVAAFAVLAGAWWWISGSRHHGNSPVAADNVLQNASNTTASSAQNGTDVSNQSTSGSTATNTASSGAANNTGSTSTTNSTTTGSQSSVTVQPYNGQGTLTVLASGSGPAVLDATAQGGQCWIEVIADGKSVDPNDFILPGKTKSFRATKELRIKLGNVPVVSLTVDGQPVSLPNVIQPIWVVVKKQ